MPADPKEVSSDHKPSPHHSLTERVEEGEVDTVETKARYLAYASRLKTAVTASSRYLAYSSGKIQHDRRDFKHISSVA